MSYWLLLPAWCCSAVDVPSWNVQPYSQLHKYRCLHSMPCRHVLYRWFRHSHWSMRPWLPLPWWQPDFETHKLLLPQRLLLPTRYEASVALPSSAVLLQRQAQCSRRLLRIWILLHTPFDKSSPHKLLSWWHLPCRTLLFQQCLASNALPSGNLSAYSIPMVSVRMSSLSTRLLLPAQGPKFLYGCLCRWLLLSSWPSGSQPLKIHLPEGIPLPCWCQEPYHVYQRPVSGPSRASSMQDL